MMTSCTYSYGFPKTRDKNIAVYRFPANCNKRNFICLFKCAYCLFFNCSSLMISIHKFLTGFYSFLFMSIATMPVPDVCLCTLFNEGTHIWASSSAYYSQYPPAAPRSACQACRHGIHPSEFCLRVPNQVRRLFS